MGWQRILKIESLTSQDWVLSDITTARNFKIKQEKRPEIGRILVAQVAEGEKQEYLDPKTYPASDNSFHFSFPHNSLEPRHLAIKVGTIQTLSEAWVVSLWALIRTRQDDLATVPSSSGAFFITLVGGETTTNPLDKSLVDTTFTLDIFIGNQGYELGRFYAWNPDLQLIGDPAVKRAENGKVSLTFTATKAVDDNEIRLSLIPC